MTSLRLHHRLEEDTSTTRKTEVAVGRYVVEECVHAINKCEAVSCVVVSVSSRDSFCLFSSETQDLYLTAETLPEVSISLNSVIW